MKIINKNVVKFLKYHESSYILFALYSHITIELRWRKIMALAIKKFIVETILGNFFLFTFFCFFFFAANEEIFLFDFARLEFYSKGCKLLRKNICNLIFKNSKNYLFNKVTFPWSSNLVSTSSIIKQQSGMTYTPSMRKIFLQSSLHFLLSSSEWIFLWHI